jgi:tripartite-type tricarboxylate transporter receptor subunit TctC
VAKLSKKSRLVSLVLMLLLCMALLGPAALAQNYPSRPITFIVPWAAGGGTDQVARILAVILERELGQPVNVVNRDGGGGAVGHSAGANARPDGYTITMATVEIAMMHWMGLTNVTVNDFRPVGQVNFDPAGVTVAHSAPWQTLEELEEEILANPGALRASGTGRGGIWDLARAGWLRTLGLPETALPWVPSAGAAPALQELVAGGVDVVTSSLPEAASLIDAGRVRPLAIMGEQRDPMFPDVPTLIERGKDWSLGAWRGIMVPKNTPDQVVKVLEEAVAKAVKDETYVEFMKNNGFGIIWRDSEEFTDFAKKQDEMFGILMKELGLAN